MASEALHLLAAIALNFPAAQDALLRQPGDVASLAARLEGPMEQAAVEVRASWCTTILGSLALRPGAGQLAGGGAVDAVAGGLQLALEQERAAPPFGPAPYANLRGCCIMAAASFVLRVSMLAVALPLPLLPPTSVGDAPAPSLCPGCHLRRVTPHGRHPLTPARVASHPLRRPTASCALS